MKKILLWALSQSWSGGTPHQSLTVIVRAFILNRFIFISFFLLFFFTLFTPKIATQKIMLFHTFHFFSSSSYILNYKFWVLLLIRDMVLVEVLQYKCVLTSTLTMSWTQKLISPRRVWVHTRRPWKSGNGAITISPIFLNCVKLANINTTKQWGYMFILQISKYFLDFV